MNVAIPIEQVQPGDKGRGRYRRNERMKRYLLAKRLRNLATREERRS